VPQKVTKRRLRAAEITELLNAQRQRESHATRNRIYASRRFLPTYLVNGRVAGGAQQARNETHSKALDRTVDMNQLRAKRRCLTLSCVDRRCCEVHVLAALAFIDIREEESPLRRVAQSGASVLTQRSVPHCDKGYRTSAPA
jgi:hypothetical protein